MSQAYTPGLIVSHYQIVRRERRLPASGEILVQSGDHVTAESIVARTHLPGLLQTIKLSEKLGLDSKDSKQALQVKIGDEIKTGDFIAESKGIFGFFKTQVHSDFTGTVESFSDITGHLFIREAPIPIEVSAYVEGKIVEILGKEGVTVESCGGLVQGIFGVGGECHGEIRVAVDSPDQILRKSHLKSGDKGKLVIGGACIDSEALVQAAEIGVAGIVVGGILDQDLIQYLGHEIGVAITGQEEVPFTLMVTEGFGELPMAENTFKLFKDFEGCHASMSGTTQIRAGVIRPEVIIPQTQTKKSEKDVLAGPYKLEPGSVVRIIREPYFGEIGEVVSLPSDLAVLDSEVEVRVLEAKLNDGNVVQVPRANVEIVGS